MHLFLQNIFEFEASGSYATIATRRQWENDSIGSSSVNNKFQKREM